MAICLILASTRSTRSGLLQLHCRLQGALIYFHSEGGYRIQGSLTRATLYLPGPWLNLHKHVLFLFHGVSVFWAVPSACDLDDPVVCGFQKSLSIWVFFPKLLKYLPLIYLWLTGPHKFHN